MSETGHLLRPAVGEFRITCEDPLAQRGELPTGSTDDLVGHPRRVHRQQRPAGSDPVDRAEEEDPTRTDQPRARSAPDAPLGTRKCPDGTIRRPRRN
ncbi:hypothetical protein KCH_10950 [Kitasatospora cheerisanensis KCTC 2395]|uniref:Uncharacterized protein n=1 Tax=Kitasatospora cheerisanensis KCTC 2395 TaxID=1348663 RepID=A0A066ZA21_9ACTN|nr:hypothetical protein KCH_10950 [Kitasatospora cheerisanensis KCTC 2395]